MCCGLGSWGCQGCLNYAIVFLVKVDTYWDYSLISPGMSLLIMYPITDLVIETIVGLVCIGPLVTPTWDPFVGTPSACHGIVLNLNFDIYSRAVRLLFMSMQCHG